MADKEFNNDVVPKPQRVMIWFNSNQEAIKQGYRLVVKTREDNISAYYKIVPVELEVMDRAEETLRCADIPATDELIRLLVRDYYRNDTGLEYLSNEKMLEKIERLRTNEENSTEKYPVLSSFGKGPLVDGKEYRIYKAR